MYLSINNFQQQQITTKYYQEHILSPCNPHYHSPFQSYLNHIYHIHHFVYFIISTVISHIRTYIIIKPTTYHGSRTQNENAVRFTTTRHRSEKVHQRPTQPPLLSLQKTRSVNPIQCQKNLKNSHPTNPITHPHVHPHLKTNPTPLIIRPPPLKTKRLRSKRTKPIPPRHKLKMDDVVITTSKTPINLLRLPKSKITTHQSSSHEK